MPLPNSTGPLFPVLGRASPWGPDAHMGWISFVAFLLSRAFAGRRRIGQPCCIGRLLLREMLGFSLARTVVLCAYRDDLPLCHWLRRIRARYRTNVLLAIVSGVFTPRLVPVSTVRSHTLFVHYDSYYSWMLLTLNAPYKYVLCPKSIVP